MPEYKMSLKGEEWIEGTLSSVLIAKRVDVETFKQIMAPQFKQPLLDPLTDVTIRDPGGEGSRKSYLKGYSLMQLAVYLNDEKGLEYLRYLLEAVTAHNNYVLEHKTTEDDESTVLHMPVENLIAKRKEEEKIRDIEGGQVGFKPFTLKCRSDYEGACQGINSRFRNYCDNIYILLEKTEEAGFKLVINQTEEGIQIGYTDSLNSAINLSTQMNPGSEDPSFLSKCTSMGEYEHAGKMYLKISSARFYEVI